jgi:hypothetical protein
MFAISREEMLAALEHMEENNQVYYDAHCPKCRRANRVERARMERFFPDWKNAIKTMSKESAKMETAVDNPSASTEAAKVSEAPKGVDKRGKKHSSKAKSAASVSKTALKPSSPEGKTAGSKKK